LSPLVKRLLTVFALVAVVLLILGYLGYRLVTRSLPVETGELTVSALETPVTVYRDPYGVPHLFAQNESDLFRAAGYLCAQDRFWQMELGRRAASGRLSEIFGSVSIEADKFLRLWGFGRIAKQMVPTLSAQSRLILEAYAEGVNSYLEKNGNRLPVEFSLLGYKPEPWHIEDSLALIRLMGWRLSFSWHVEPAMARIVEKVGLRKAADIFPGFPSEGPMILQRYSSALGQAGRTLLAASHQAQDLLGWLHGPTASNSWVVSGRRSVTGKPLLANDPHLELSVPALFYEMHLKGGPFDVAGVVIPGIPGVVIGHNRAIAWGLTNGMIDDADFFFERVNPENPKQYLTPDGWRDFELRREVIAVKDSEDVVFDIRFSRHGPVVSDVHPLARDGDTLLVVQWTGQQVNDDLRAFIGVNTASNWEEFEEAVHRFVAPAQNFVYADTAGNIGYLLGGTVPLRRDNDGMLPDPGWTGEGDWIGRLPDRRKPHAFNPPQGYLVTANNPFAPDMPVYMSYLWESTGRAQRIRELLTAKEKHSLEDFARYQLDRQSPEMRKIYPYLLETLKADEEATSRYRGLYDLCQAWDLVESPESIPAAIVQVWFYQLIANTFKDEMADTLFQEYVQPNNIPIRVMLDLLDKPDSPWWDDVTTPERERQNDIFQRSLRATFEYLRSEFGDTVSDWRWGRVHTLTFRHPLAVRRPLDLLFNLGPYEIGGSATTVAKAEYQFIKPFAVSAGPVTRQLVDLGDINRSLAVLSTGQSGQKFSRHYGDQTPLWLEGRLHPMPMDSSLVAAQGWPVQTLLPGQR
jgi:penicillin amidase